ncbi:MAG: hypothetical protein FE78DRAFT_77055 [Acidomyces sp. 'richmondensis']|nr:MAG: hypothetical protein FE78DRAFT_77055 [Acidomyces sp. 'richmondensis']
MARASRKWQALALLAFAPDLSTATQTTSSSSATSDSSSSFVTTGGASATDSSIFSLSGLPTIAGAGIPTLVIPYTANAPFMQKSNLPEGTVFIAVGAVLAFLGACVLLWRGLVAWSINRSVRKTAMASIRGSEKNGGSTWGGSSGYHPVNGSHYRDYAGSVLSLDHLAGSGKPMKPHFRDSDAKRDSTPPAGLFFSPTASAGLNRDANRSSSFLPAGYYASPAAQPAGGAGSTTIGGNYVAPYARHSQVGPSPPGSPGLPPQSRGSTTYRASSRDGLRAPRSRDGYGSARNSYMDGTPRHSTIYAQPSSSSLMVGTGGAVSSENITGSRAPSAYLEDLFENHGNGPRERF